MSLVWRCIVCGAPRGEPCINMINPKLPLPGRAEHHARALPPGRTPK